MDTTERHARKWMSSPTYEGGLMRHEGKHLLDVIDTLRKENTNLLLTNKKLVAEIEALQEKVARLEKQYDFLNLQPCPQCEQAEASLESEMKARDDAEVKLGRCREEKEQAEQKEKELREALERTENFLLGLHRDPAIPDHARDAVFVKASDIDNALNNTKE
jgi:chromosome segregation ATPase